MRVVPQAAIDLVKASEGFRAKRNLDPAAKPEIGYGHWLARNDSLWGATLTEEDAAEIAEADLERVAQELTDTLGVPLVTALTESQWAALLDFTFNEGIGHFQTSTLCHMIQLGQLKQAAKQFGRWIYAGNPPVVEPGLVTRRAVEKALWLS